MPRGSYGLQHRNRDLYVDQVAVQRRIDGERVPLTHAEKAAAIEALQARGLTFSRACQQLGFSNSWGRNAIAVRDALAAARDGCVA